MKKTISVLVIALGISLPIYSQEAPASVSNDSLNKSLNALKKDVDFLKNLKITGWVQAQWQLADTVGAKNFDGGDFPNTSDNRFMIRRGRVKFTYNQKNSQYVLQINATERGVNLVEIFGKYTDPWKHAFSITAGVMNRPFGFEIQQSSADRETPERSRYVQILMPNERDCGAMLTYQPQKGSKLFGLKIDAGLFNGTGIAVPGTTSLSQSGVLEFDAFKDFIGRLHYNRSMADDKVKFGVGFSHYNGGYALQSNKYYKEIKTDTAGNKYWSMADTTGINFRRSKTPRVYYGVEFQFSVTTIIGTTTLRGEYITGTQSGKDADSKSPASAPSSTGAIYVRNFNGGNAYLVQRIGKTKHEVAVKYEWYDPNTKVAGSVINSAYGFKEGDIKYTMLGVGYNLYLTQNVKFMFYYNMVTNELVKISGFTRDLKDNIFTARLQYRF